MKMHKGLGEVTIFAKAANCVAISAATVLLAMPIAAPAQSVGDFRLQPVPSGTPRAPGPVDADAPVVRSRQPDPIPTPTPAASPTASATPSATPAPAPVAARTPAAQPSATRVPAVRPTPVPSAATTPSPQAQPSETASASPSASPQPATLATTDASAAASEPAQAVVPATQSSASWLWLAGIALAIAAFAGTIWQRRRRAREVPAEDQWPEEIAETPVAEDALAFAPAPAAKPETAPQPTAAAPLAAPLAATKTPLPACGADQLTIALMLDPVRLSATLINTSLSYRLSVTNTGSAPLSDVMVAGGMISAHASLPVEQQLATDGQMLELLHQIEMLAPGETAELSGDLRLPLPQITPIRSGQALLFIPLARFRVESGVSTTLATFVIGETPPVAEAALLPFRIDMGPRIWSSVSRRRVDRPVAA